MSDNDKLVQMSTRGLEGIIKLLKDILDDTKKPNMVYPRKLAIVKAKGADEAPSTICRHAFKIGDIVKETSYGEWLNSDGLSQIVNDRDLIIYIQEL